MPVELLTRTGCFHLSTSDSKFASPISMIGLLSGFCFHFLDSISDSQTGRFALFLGKRGGRGRKVWTSDPNELTPSEPARRIFNSPAKTSCLVIITGCLSSCRVVGFKPVFNRRTAG